MDQYSFTSTDYLKTHTMDQTSSEAQATFEISIDASASSTTTVDTEFEKDTSTTSVVAHGGVMQDDDQWTAWANSVQELENVACLDWTAIELSDLLGPSWTSDPELNGRAAPMKSGINSYFNRTGCTDPAASNYNSSALVDDGSCVDNPPAETRSTSLICGPSCDPNTLTLGLNDDQQSAFHSSGGWKCHCIRDSGGILHAEIKTDPAQTVTQCTGSYIADGSPDISLASCLHVYLSPLKPFESKQNQSDASSNSRLKPRNSGGDSMIPPSSDRTKQSREFSTINT